MRIAVEHISRIMSLYDGAYNPPKDIDLPQFAEEYGAIYDSVLSRASKFFPKCDLLEGVDGVQISPRNFASSRKIGFIIDSPEYQSAELLDWLTETVLEIDDDYLITVDMYTELGQAYLCVSKSGITAWGPRKALLDLGIQTDDEYTPLE